MVSVDYEFGNLFFQIFEVVDNRCIEVGFNVGGGKVSSAFTFPLFSELNPMLRPVMLVQFGFF